MLTDWVQAIEQWATALVGSPWVFPALYAFATIDGFFPPVPSESVVIALSTLSIATGDPNLWIVIVVAAAGAFTGDQIAYSIGKRIPVRRIRIMKGPRARRALDWAEKALAERGPAFIIAARYVPIGRVAVNMTAGTVRFPRRRFSMLAAFAAVTWAFYSVALGVLAGAWLGDQPWLAVLAGIVVGVLLGIVMDTVIQRWSRARLARRSVPVAAAGPADDDGVTVRPAPAARPVADA